MSEPLASGAELLGTPHSEGPGTALVALSAKRPPPPHPPLLTITRYPTETTCVRKGSRWLMVSETFQSISGGEGMVTGGQRGGCHLVRTRKWRELDQRQG